MGSQWHLRVNITNSSGIVLFSSRLAHLDHWIKIKRLM
uniref:Uncharacterized protein n=1 Tax=Arundo donax TaxID=35708 RepID=A0A0A9HJ98_ARUDO